MWADMRHKTRRRALVIAAPLLVVVAALLLLLVLGGDDRDERAPRPRPSAPAGLEPLAFMPAGASAVLDFDTTQAPGSFAAIGLIPELPGSPLDAGQVQRLTGGRIAVALAGERVWIAAQTRAAPPRPPRELPHGGRAGPSPVAARAG